MNTMANRNPGLSLRVYSAQTSKACLDYQKEKGTG